MFGIDASVLALIGTIIATVGVKLVERWLTSKDRSSTDAAQIRSELKVKADQAQTTVDRLENEVDEWRMKYFAVVEELHSKRLELQTAVDQIKKLQEQIESLAQEALRRTKDAQAALDIPPSN